MKKIFIVLSALACTSALALGSHQSNQKVLPINQQPLQIDQQIFETFNHYYFGLQGGYIDSGMNIWDRNYFKIKNNYDISTRFYVGYKFTKYISVESGILANLEQVHINKENYGTLDQKDSINFYNFDTVIKFTVPVYKKFNLYGKIGPGYLYVTDKTKFKHGDGETYKTHVKELNTVYGVGAEYQINNQFATDISLLHCNSLHRKLDSANWQPDMNFYSVGVTYSF